MKYFGLLALIACCFVLTYSTQPLKAGSLQGYVYDSLTSLPIDSAHVDGICLDTTAEFHKITDFNGYYFATNLPNGRWSVPETLFESELFGHRKGAFTGAIDEKKGLFEDAEQGTLFLDDIPNAPLSVQPKLLQAIEEKIIRRLGEIEERRIDVRLISATNQDLKKMMRKGLFRADLYYRINVLTIHVASLKIFNAVGRPVKSFNHSTIQPNRLAWR